MNTPINVCQCQICKDMCKRPCWGTPDDIWALLKAGRGQSLEEDHWRMDNRNDVWVLRPRLGEDGYCVFFKDGLCTLHARGLKPLEGRVAMCSDDSSRSGRGVPGKDYAQNWEIRASVAHAWSKIGWAERRIFMREWEYALGWRRKRKPGPKRRERLPTLRRLIEKQG